MYLVKPNETQEGGVIYIGAVGTDILFTEAPLLRCGIPFSTPLGTPTEPRRGVTDTTRQLFQGSSTLSSGLHEGRATFKGCCITLDQPRITYDVETQC